MEDIFRKDDGTTLAEGRRKIYSTVTPMKLLLPNGTDDGVLEKDDLVYVAKRFKKDNKHYFRFMVLKFAKTDKQKKIYCGEAKYFKQHFEKDSNAEGDTKPTETEIQTERNYIVPVITGLGLGTIGYVLAKKFDKNGLLFGGASLILGLVIGNYIANKKLKK